MNLKKTWDKILGHKERCKFFLEGHCLKKVGIWPFTDAACKRICIKYQEREQ